MRRKSLTREDVLRLLTETPLRIEAVTADLDARQLREPAPDGGWSANLVLAHLRSCADVWGDCIAAILAEDRPTLRAVNPRTWIKSTDYAPLDFRTSFRSFLGQRQQLLGILDRAPREAWSRSAAVVGAGPVLERSLHFYAEWLAVHERSHLRQFERLP